eukprot:710335-Amphidinium_carterae.1
MNKQLQDNGFKREVSVSYVRTFLKEIGYKWKKRVPSSAIDIPASVAEDMQSNLVQKVCYLCADNAISHDKCWNLDEIATKIVP